MAIDDSSPAYEERSHNHDQHSHRHYKGQIERTEEIPSHGLYVRIQEHNIHKNKEYVTEQHKPAHGPDKAIAALEVFDRKQYRINN